MPDSIQEQIDEINMKLDRVAEILWALRSTWTQIIPDPETDVEDTNPG